MKRFLTKNALRRFTLFLGLSLLLCAMIRAQQNEQRVIHTIEELTEALATPSLRSDEVKTYIIADEGIAVTKEIPVGAGKFILKGGPLYRAEDYTGVMVRVKEGASIEFANTLNGSLLQTHNAAVWIEKGGSMVLSGTLQNAICEDAVVINAGTFTLQGGVFTNNKCKGGYVIMSLGGSTYLSAGKISANACVGSIDAEVGSSTILNPQKVGLSGTDLNMFMAEILWLTDALSYTLAVQTNMKEGATLVSGTGTAMPYQLTEADCKNVNVSHTINPNLTGELQNGGIVLVKKVVIPDIITTQEELQAAIDAATGTAANPTEIKIAEAGFTLTKTINVGSGKYITLTGGTITGGLENFGSMFTIENAGSVTLREITIDGGCTGQEKACWGFAVRGGILKLEDASMLKGFGLTEDVSVVFLCQGQPYQGGQLIMNGGRIQDNFFFNKDHLSMCSVVSIVDVGYFEMKSGAIVNNQGDYHVIYLQGQGDSSMLSFSGGVIGDNGNGWIQSNGGFIRIEGASGAILQPIHLTDKESYISLSHPLNEQLVFYKESFTDGYVLAHGNSTNNPLTQEDVAKIKLPEGYTAVLQDNQVVVKVGDPEPVFDLQALIDAAEVGTLENPSVITLTEDVVLSKAIAVKGKHIKLAGGKTISASIANSQSLYMFNVTENGSLTLDNITLDGTAEGYVTFASVEKDATLQLINGTTLKDAKSKADGVLLVEGNLVMKGCVFTNNTIEASYSALIVLGSNSQWTCSNSVIQGNQAYKEVDGKKVYGYVCSSWGQATIQECSILENDAYAIHALNTMSLSYVGWKYNACDIMLVPASSDGHERTYVGTGGEPTTMAIIGEYGVNHLMFSGEVTKKIAVVESGIVGCVIAEGYNGYQLTEQDLAQFTLENKEGYTLLLEDNKIVMREEVPVINTQAKLQAAIDASNGTVETPEEITLTGEIAISSTIKIENKHVRLTGGTLKKATSGNLNMLYVNQGTLELTNITLDGAHDKLSGYCSFIQAYSYRESRVDIGEGAKLTNALGGDSRENTLVCASAELTTLNGGEITGNFVEDGAVLFVDWGRTFVMNSGLVAANQNMGYRYMMSVIEGAGEITINGGTVSSDTRNCLAFYLYGAEPFIIGKGTHIVGEINMYNNRKITIASALVNPITFSFFSSNQPTGRIVAVPADDYTLTDGDLNKIHYAVSNIYGLRLQDGNIVAVNLAAENKTFQVKVADVAHGSLTVNKTTAKQNEQITVTVTPDEGYKLYSLVYNETNELTQAPTGTNVYTFQMPPKDVTISAQFIKDNTTVKEPETEDPNKEDPDEIRPGKTIGNLDDLIDALNKGNEDGTTEITPETKTPTIDEDDPINDEIAQAENDGAEVIGSIDVLINVLNKNADGTSTPKVTLTILPAKVTMRLYLPNRLFTSTTLRATTSPYYILNQYSQEGELKVATIETEYDEESHSVTFETDRLGIFVVMRGTLKEPETPVIPIIPIDPIIPDDPIDVANAAVNGGQPIVYVAGSRIVIEGLGVGQSYAIYDLSGQILKAGVADGSAIYFLPNASSNYVVRYGRIAQIIHFEK